MTPSLPMAKSSFKSLFISVSSKISFKDNVLDLINFPSEVLKSYFIHLLPETSNNDNDWSS